MRTLQNTYNKDFFIVNVNVVERVFGSVVSPAPSRSHRERGLGRARGAEDGLYGLAVLLREGEHRGAG